MQIHHSSANPNQLLMNTENSGRCSNAFCFNPRYVCIMIGKPRGITSYARTLSSTSLLWTEELRLSRGYFVLLYQVVEILRVVQNMTTSASTETCWVGDVVPLMSSAVNAVRQMEVTSDACILK